jgi:alpha-galactosidase
MQGALGIGSNLNKFTDADNALATKMIALDKRIRETVQLGDLYRLLLPDENDTTSNEYVSKDGKEAVVFAFRHSQEYGTRPPTIHLRGLDPKAVYETETMDGKSSQLSGAYLMQNGVDVQLKGDFDSTILLVHRIQ